MPRKIGLVMLLQLALGASSVWAAGGEAFTDPSQAGPDFTIQGEYLGDAKLAGKDTRLGVQVIALGQGTFRAVVYSGGLPGEVRAGEDKKEAIEGKTEGSATVFKGPNWSAKIAGGKLTVSDSGGMTLGTLEKIERKSPTLGAKPPAGAVVLFDGSNADAWNGGKLSPEGLLEVGCKSKQEFKDFTLHVEFRTPFMPKSRGQGRGNSGVYLQDRYEVQVLDSFGLEGENNECGGLYSVQKPAVNMCLPPLSWQTYDIDFTAARFEGDNKVKNARMTIKHNGVAIYDDFEMPKLTPGGAKTEAPGKGPFALQNHGNPVNFRNIWVVEK